MKPYHGGFHRVILPVPVGDAGGGEAGGDGPSFAARAKLFSREERGDHSTVSTPVFSDWGLTASRDGSTRRLTSGPCVPPKRSLVAWLLARRPRGAQ